MDPIPADGSLLEGLCLVADAESSRRSSSATLWWLLPSYRLGDHIGLQQVLINLITNALEAMRGSSSETLEIGTIMPSPDKLMVSVGDSGMGIDETTKGNLFTPFFTTKKDGLGAGLGICQAIIEAHGGRIWVENNSHGGATFSVSLKANPGEFK